MFHLRPLSILLRDHFNMRVNQLKQADPSLSSPVYQSSLVFWPDQELISQRVPLQLPAPTQDLTTDASLYGCWIVCSPLSPMGIWSRDYVRLHINYLQLETIFLALNNSRGFQICVEHISYLRQTVPQ